MTNKVTMPIDKAIEAVEMVLEHTNQTGTSPEYAIGISMALDALREQREKWLTNFERITASAEVMAKELSITFCHGYGEAQILDWLNSVEGQEMTNRKFSDAECSKRCTNDCELRAPRALTATDIASALLALANGDHDNGVLQMLGKTSLLRIAADLIDKEEREK